MFTILRASSYSAVRLYHKFGAFVDKCQYQYLLTDSDLVPAEADRDGALRISEPAVETLTAGR